MDRTRTTQRRLFAQAIALALACGLLFAACASGTTNRSASGETTTTNPVATVAPGDTILPDTSLLPTSTTTSSAPTSSTVPESNSSTTTTTISGEPTPSSTSTSSTTVPGLRPAVALVYPCAKSVRLGPFEALVDKNAPEDCLYRIGVEWRSTKKVFVGGMEFRPAAPDATFTFDPLNAHVHAVGYQVFGSIFGGQLLVDEGVIDWSFQYNPGQNSAPGWAMPVKNDTIKLSTIGKLQGLSGVTSYPKQPVNGFPDYSVVTEDSVKQLVGSVPSLATPDVVFTLDQVGLTAIPAFTLSLPSEIIQKVAGLQVEAAVTLQPVERSGALGIALFGRLKLPSVLQGYFGELGVFWPVNGPTRLEKLMVQIPEIDLAVVRFKGIDLRYSVGDDLWAGKITVLFGAGADALGFGGTIRIQNGELKEIGVKVEGLPINIYGVASINTLGGNLRLDPYGIKATTQVGVGPFVPKAGNVAVIDGEIILDTNELLVSGVGTIGKIMVGNLELKGMRVADMKVAYYWDGIASISGNGELYLDTAKQWGVGVALRGSANATDISLGGDATISLGGVRLSATSAVSTKGVIACGIFKGMWFDDVRLGLSKDWTEPAWRLRSDDCNSKEYEVPVAPVNGETGIGGGRNAAGEDSAKKTFTVNVADGQKMVTFAIGGGKNSATVTAPDGTEIEVTGLEQSTQSAPIDARWYVIREPSDSVSYVIFGKPMGGTWTITTSGDAVPTLSTSVVDAKSQPREAMTQTLEPTQVGAPLTALPEDPTTPKEAGDTILETLVVLAVLFAGLGVTLVIMRRRQNAA
jgi:hypothetical protein